MLTAVRLTLAVHLAPMFSSSGHRPWIEAHTDVPSTVAMIASLNFQPDFLPPNPKTCSHPAALYARSSTYRSRITLYQQPSVFHHHATTIQMKQEATRSVAFQEIDSKVQRTQRVWQCNIQSAETVFLDIVGEKPLPISNKMNIQMTWASKVKGEQSKIAQPSIISKLVIICHL